MREGKKRRNSLRFSFVTIVSFVFEKWFLVKNGRAELTNSLADKMSARLFVFNEVAVTLMVTPTSFQKDLGVLEELRGLIVKCLLPTNSNSETVPQ